MGCQGFDYTLGYYYERTSGFLAYNQPISVMLWLYATSDVPNSSYATAWMEASAADQGAILIETNGLDSGGPDDQKIICRAGVNHTSPWEPDSATSWGPSCDSTNSGLDKWFWVCGVINGTSYTNYWSEGLGAITKNQKTLDGSINQAFVASRIGLDTRDWGEYWRGRLAGLKCWQAELSEAEVASERPYYLAQRRSGIWYVIPMEDGGQATMQDFSGNGRHFSKVGSGCSYVAGPSFLSWDANALSHRITEPRHWSQF